MATTNFSLPVSSLPSTNPMPSSTLHGSRGSVVKMTKGQPRAIVVEIKDDHHRTPRSSADGDHSSTARTSAETAPSSIADSGLAKEPSPSKSPRDRNPTPIPDLNSISASTEENRTLTTPPPGRPAKSRHHPRLTINTGAPVNISPPAQSNASSMTLRDDIADEAQSGTGARITTVTARGATAENSEETPVMRSMFPRLDPAVRLSRQDYVPVPGLLPPPPPLPASKQGRLSSASGVSSLYSPPLPASRAATAADATRTSAQLATAAPARIIEHADHELSTSEELLDLWTIANGQLCPESKDVYTLGLQCDSLTHDRESMQFTSCSANIYQLHASGSTVVLTRSHPISTGASRAEITISTPAIRTPSTSSPLLATIFPSLAELLALDTASNVALANQLSRQDSASLQAEALHRARATEAASLLWDSDSAKYFFTIPALHNPTAPVPQALPITLVPGKSIVLLDPARRPLLSLNLHDALLSVHSTNIVALSASLYTLDLLVSTLLTLLLHLHRHTALLAPYAVPIVVPQFDPPPKAASAYTAGSPRPSSRVSRSSRRSKSAGRPASKLNRWLSRSGATSVSAGSKPLASPAPCSPYYASPYAMASPCTKDLEAALSATTLHHTLSRPPMLASALPALPAQGIAPELRQDTTGVDLSRFQAYDLSDPELGSGTRALLRVLYWFFGVLVWLLGVAVGVIAAATVALGGCLGGKGKEGRIDGGREG